MGSSKVISKVLTGSSTVGLTLPGLVAMSGGARKGKLEKASVIVLLGPMAVRVLEMSSAVELGSPGT